MLHVITGDKRRPLCPVLFLDIKRAFDRVDHTILLQRLHDAGVCGKAWLWIRSFLRPRRIRTVDNSLCSAWQEIKYGVPQGCVLSPLLFLVFIESAARAILTDSQCALVKPVLFADDAAIVPSALLRLPDTATVKTVNASYRAHMLRAIDHLDQWCRDSRMQFGPDKTKIVLFHAQQEHPTAAQQAAYSGFQVCGFTIGLAESYTYLGLDLAAHQLSWTLHRRRALAACRSASARVMRVALRATEPSLSVIRTLINGFVIPSCMYGAMFWARDTSDQAARLFQNKFAAPLRAALHLPTTTHQLGTLVMCGVSSFRAEVLKDELRFISRLQRLETTDPAHPTAVLARKHAASVGEHDPRAILTPFYLLPTAIHILTTTVPDVLDPGQDGLARHLGAADRGRLCPPNLAPPPADLRRGVEYWASSGADRYKNNAPTVFGPATHASIVKWSARSCARLTPPTISRLGLWRTFLEWKAQHAAPPAVQPAAPPAAPPPAPPPAPAPASLRDHSTAAPLTECQTAPGCAFFLTAA
ncbi:MAG TPA: reverse transcriptase domain-containing protein, partial [Acidobacteriaceae bacterium]